MSENARVRLRERFARIEFVVVIVVVAISLLIFGTAIPRLVLEAAHDVPGESEGHRRGTPHVFQ